jgi:hypothetical protein
MESTVTNEQGLTPQIDQIKLFSMDFPQMKKYECEPRIKLKMHLLNPNFLQFSFHKNITFLDIISCLPDAASSPVLKKPKTPILLKI